MTYCKHYYKQYHHLWSHVLYRKYKKQVLNMLRFVHRKWQQARNYLLFPINHRTQTWVHIQTYNFIDHRKNSVTDLITVFSPATSVGPPSTKLAWGSCPFFSTVLCFWRWPIIDVITKRHQKIGQGSYIFTPPKHSAVFARCWWCREVTTDCSINMHEGHNNSFTEINERPCSCDC